MRSDMAKSKEELMEVRKQMIGQMEQRLQEINPEEDKIFLSVTRRW